MGGSVDESAKPAYNESLASAGRLLEYLFNEMVANEAYDTY